MPNPIVHWELNTPNPEKVRRFAADLFGWTINVVPEMSYGLVLTNAGQSAWLDVSPQEFSAIPEVEVVFDVWEGVMCAGNPPPVP